MAVATCFTVLSISLPSSATRRTRHHRPLLPWYTRLVLSDVSVDLLLVFCWIGSLLVSCFPQDCWSAWPGGYLSTSSSSPREFNGLESGWYGGVYMTRYRYIIAMATAMLKGGVCGRELTPAVVLWSLFVVWHASNKYKLVKLAWSHDLRWSSIIRFEPLQYFRALWSCCRCSQDIMLLISRSIHENIAWSMRHAKLLA